MCMYLKDYMYGLDIIWFIYTYQHILCIFVLNLYSQYFYTHAYQYKLLGILVITEDPLAYFSAITTFL